MKKKEKKFIVEHYQDKCDCSDDDNCGCSYPNNTKPDFDASNREQLPNVEDILDA